MPLERSFQSNSVKLRLPSILRLGWCQLVSESSLIIATKEGKAKALHFKSGASKLISAALLLYL